MEFPNHCQRCGKQGCAVTMSIFDTEMICLECEKKEKKHPEYEKAKSAELKEVQRGNYNFRGIGKPTGL